MTNTITRSAIAMRTAARNPRSRRIVGGLMAAIGVLVILIEVALHVYSAVTHTHYEMDHWALLIGTVIGFWGFAWSDTKTAAGAATVVVGSAGQIIRAVRGGRRSTDTPVVVATKTEEKP